MFMDLSSLSTHLFVVVLPYFVAHIALAPLDHELSTLGSEHGTAALLSLQSIPVGHAVLHEDLYALGSLSSLFLPACPSDDLRFRGIFSCFLLQLVIERPTHALEERIRNVRRVNIRSTTTVELYAVLCVELAPKPQGFDEFVGSETLGMHDCKLSESLGFHPNLLCTST